MTTSSVMAPATAGAAGRVYAGAALDGQVAERRKRELSEDLDDLRQAVESGDAVRVWNAAVQASYAQGRAGRAADGLRPEVERLLGAALALLLGGGRR